MSWFPELSTVLVCDFLLRWPALDQLRSVKRTTLLNFFRAHHSVRSDTLEKRLAAIKESMPLTTDRVIINSSVLMITALAAQMKTTIEAISQFDREIQKLCAAHPDFPLFQSLPGAGEVYASRLLAVMGTKRDRWTTAQGLACLSGIAPVMERSGQSVWIRWRYFCPKFMRQSFHEYAGESVKHSFWARAYYEQQIAKGKSRRLRSERSLTSGSGSSGSAGKPALLTVRSNILRVCERKVPLCWLTLPKVLLNQKSLDSSASNGSFAATRPLT